MRSRATFPRQARRGHLLPALVAALLWGGVLGLGALVVARRAEASAGTPGLPGALGWTLTATALLGLLGAGARVGPRAAGLLSGMSACAAVVLALLAEWLLGHRASTFLGWGVAMAAPTLLLFLTAGFAARAHAARPALLCAACAGLAMALWSAPELLARTGLGSGVRLAAALLLPCGALFAFRGRPAAVAPATTGGLGVGVLLGASLGLALTPLLDTGLLAGLDRCSGAAVAVLALGLGVGAASARPALGLWAAWLLVLVLASGALVPGAEPALGWILGALAVLGLLAGPVLARAATLAHRGSAVALAAAVLVIGAGAVLGPRLPEAAWWAMPGTAGALGALLLVRTTPLGIPVALLALGWLALWPPALPQDTVGTVLLARRGEATAEFVRRGQQVALRSGGRVCDRAGPDHRHGELLAHLGRALGPTAERTVVLGLGTGRVVRSLQAWTDRGVVEVVCHRDADLRLWGELQNDGAARPRPVPAFALPAQTVLRRSGLRSFLGTAAAASVDLGLVSAPLGCAEPWLCTEEFHVLARRALGPGLLLQSFHCAEVPPRLLRAALASAAEVHGWAGVFLFGDIGVLLCGVAPPDFQAAGAELRTARSAVGWQLHRAGMGGPEDLELALLGVVPPGGAGLRDDGLATMQHSCGDEQSAVEVLREVLGRSLTETGRVLLSLRSASATERTAALRELSRLQQRHPTSVLLHDEETRVKVAEAVEIIAALDPGDLAAKAQGAAAAAGLLHLGCPHAVLQAALALPDRIGVALRSPEEAVACALAIDPTLAARPPGILAPLLAGAQPGSPLEDFAVLPAADRLLGLCAGHDAVAVGLQTRFRSDCAAVLVAEMGCGPLGEAGLTALRRIADPFVLGQVAQALTAERRLELIALWRFDLPLVPALAELIAGSTAERTALAAALRGRQDGPSLLCLADLLMDQELEVRTVAGSALSRTLGEKIAYDPRWAETRLRAAAEQVRALHNRTP